MQYDIHFSFDRAIIDYWRMVKVTLPWGSGRTSLGDGNTTTTNKSDICQPRDEIIQEFVLQYRTKSTSNNLLQEIVLQYIYGISH